MEITAQLSGEAKQEFWQQEILGHKCKKGSYSIP